MAIENKTNQNQNQQQVTQAAQTQQGTMGSNFGGQQQPQQQQQGSFSFRNVGGLFNAPMGRNPTSEVLTKLTKALNEILVDKLDKQFEATLIPIDRENTETINVSVLVVAVRHRDNKDLGVAHHTLILEGSTEPVPPRIESINGQQVEIIRTVGDAYDDEMIRTVSAAVQRQFPQSRLFDADACVVPADFNMADMNAVVFLAVNAVYAAATEIETKKKGFVDMNLANAVNDSSLTVRTTFGNGQKIDAVGQPVRADISIDLTAAPLNQGQRNDRQWSVEKVTQVSHIDAFIDLVYDPMQQPQSLYSQPQMVNFQKYLVRCVITNLESAKLMTIPAQLLALVTAMSLHDNETWVHAFRQPHRAGKEIDMHDIGAIGIECNFDQNPTGVGTRVNTRSDSFKPELLAKLIRSAVRPILFMSMDVPECGPQTWYNSVFAAAASNNENANQAIIDAANQLTNGAFNRHFPQGGRVAIDENNRIHMGTYVDTNGVKRDIRDIDYLAVLNRTGETDPVITRNWSDTFERTNFPLALRLQDRQRTIQNLVSEVKITGFAKRVTFEPAFILALTKACQEAGLKVASVTPYTDLGGYERATSQYTSHAMSTSEPTGLFNRSSFGQPAQNFGYNRGFNANRQY